MQTHTRPHGQKVPFVRMHEILAKRIEGLDPRGKPDVTFTATTLLDLKHSVPVKHRQELIEIVNRKLDARRWNTSKTAQKMARNLRRFKSGMIRTVDSTARRPAIARTPTATTRPRTVRTAPA